MADEPRRRMNDGDVTLGEVARRLDKLGDDMKEAFAEMRLTLADFITRVEYQEFKNTLHAEKQARDERLAKIEATITWVIRAIGTVVISAVLGVVIYGRVVR